MESLKQLKDLRQNDLMVKIDPKDAYYSIPLHPETQRYVRFQWKENLNQFLSLFWSGTYSQDLHQTFKNSYISSTENKHPTDNLPR